MLGVPNGGLSTPGTDRVPGLRRVDWLRVVVAPGECQAEAVGVGHRLPAAVRLPLRMAAELARVGVPVVVQRRPPPGERAGA